jgi:MerR family transcriptional regulator, copper efflux regulator
MSEPVPIACTLTSADLAAQARRWERLIAGALTGRAEIADGLRLSFRAGAADELRALVAVEAECCPWATWRVKPTAGSVVLDVRSPGEGAAVLHAMFTDGRPSAS